MVGRDPRRAGLINARAACEDARPTNEMLNDVQENLSIVKIIFKT
jgi:hypothetical protein